VIAARAAKLLPHLKDVALWADLGAYELLLRIPTRQLTSSALPAPLQALMAHDSHGRLWETLASYLDHASSSPATATALHIHRTSLYYLLDQIQTSPDSTSTTATTGWSCISASGWRGSSTLPGSRRCAPNFDRTRNSGAEVSTPDGCDVGYTGVKSWHAARSTATRRIAVTHPATFGRANPARSPGADGQNGEAMSNAVKPSAGQCSHLTGSVHPCDRAGRL